MRLWGGLGHAHDSGTSLQPVIRSAVPAHSEPARAAFGLKKAARTQIQRLRRLVGLHLAVRASLTCSVCGHRGHTKEAAKRVLGVDTLLGCPYEACCLCNKVGHASRDCESPTPSDLPALLAKWLYVPWLHHSDVEAYLASADAEIARLRSELTQHAPGQDGRRALLTVHTLAHVSFDVPPAPCSERVETLEHVQEQAGRAARSDAKASLKDCEARRGARRQ